MELSLTNDVLLLLRWSVIVADVDVALVGLVIRLWKSLVWKAGKSFCMWLQELTSNNSKLKSLLKSPVIIHIFLSLLILSRMFF